jgi:hypothetical protein
MPKPPKAVQARRAKRRIVSSGSASRPTSLRRATESPSGQRSAGKLNLYEILYILNQGFEQVFGQLQQLEKLGVRRQAWRAFQVLVEETRAEINFELVERLAEREERDWTHFGRLRHQREKKYRDPQDVLIEADRLRQRMKKRPTQRRGSPQE